MGIFRDTTTVAIGEMMAEFGQESRFGRVFTEEDMLAASTRLSAFFEMTLQLRSQYSGAAVPAEQPTQAPRKHKSNSVGLGSGYVNLGSQEVAASEKKWTATAKNAENISQLNSKNSPSSAQNTLIKTAEVQGELYRLPRKKVNFNEMEKEQFSGQRRGV
jgi:hypothetical protein